jgi:hypothetical protein
VSARVSRGDVYDVNPPLAAPIIFIEHANKDVNPPLTAPIIFIEHANELTRHRSISTLI